MIGMGHENISLRSTSSGPLLAWKNCLLTGQMENAVAGIEYIGLVPSRAADCNYLSKVFTVSIVMLSNH